MTRSLSALAAAAIAAAACLTGCGSGGKPAVAGTPTPTATVVLGGTSPVPASGPATGATKGKGPALATGKHDHLGELCSGRDEARYGAEGMTCIVGRLQRTPAAAARGARHGRHRRTARQGDRVR